MILADLVRGQHTRRVAAVDTCFFDVLHDAADGDGLAVAQRVYIDLERVVEELVDQHRMAAPCDVAVQPVDQ